jgi:hypothetical protein
MRRGAAVTPLLHAACQLFGCLQEYVGIPLREIPYKKIGISRILLLKTKWYKVKINIRKENLCCKGGTLTKQ